MAADLVQHSNIIHTFVHDLESAFWVILWLAFSHMSNSWSTEDRSSFLNETMSPRVYGDSGGRGKCFFLRDPHSLSDFSITNNTILTDLLLSLKKTFSVRYRPRPSTSSAVLDPLALKAETEGDATSPISQNTILLEEEIKEYDGLQACLQDHTVVVALVERALSSSGWPIDDAADPQDFVSCDEVLVSARTGSKRSRSVAEVNGVHLRPPMSKRSASSE